MFVVFVRLNTELVFMRAGCFYWENWSNTVFTAQKEGDRADSAVNELKRNYIFNALSQRGMLKDISSVIAVVLLQCFPSSC